jgi:hypothetical protein
MHVTKQSNQLFNLSWYFMAIYTNSEIPSWIYIYIFAFREITYMLDEQLLLRAQINKQVAKLI